ncbi:GlcG/HbpS family heme-binding protein [Alkalilimnicola sp. S0819]|uniref:GlcG/HbpS family heme-binding protein n=1 Tax=Alkalilimnicola sp. S0819 TaxID=2613922 RepID=UPI001261F909|nr:heme-binding protein [Alkalilimnicola sp. S0819]KAB7623342.1 heme-binding protein [Alkalilimnicola sp. S0819]MPQ16881.1 heme-binding protein [Alkalilimnicola sp. S0819]
MQITVSASGLDWRAAQQAVGAALREAEKLGVRMNVAVVDRAGTPMAFGRMHGAPLHSIGIAEDKAYTAASFGFSTADWDRVVAGNENLKAGLGSRPRLVMFGGGLPLIVDGECVGGIGCSGGSEEQDQLCARAGLAALGL